MLSMTWLGGTTFSAGDWNSGARHMVTTWSSRVVSSNDAWRTHDGSVLSNDPTELVSMDLASKASVPLDISRTEPASYVNTNQELRTRKCELFLFMLFSYSSPAISNTVFAITELSSSPCPAAIVACSSC